MTKRYPTIKTQQVEAVALAVGGFGVLWLLFVAVLLQTGTGQPSAGVVATALVPGLALIGLGVFLSRRWPRQWLSVDPEARVARFFANGAVKWSAPLDEFTALTVREMQRQVREDGQLQLRTDYEVLAGSREVRIASKSTYMPARRAAVRTARLWRIGLVPLDGRLRSTAQLDTPLWQLPGRANGAGDAIATVPSSLAVEHTREATTISPSAARRRSATIRIDARTVAYGSHSVPTADVVEVAEAEAVLIITPHDHLSIPFDFVDVSQTGALTAALRQTIVRYGAQSSARANDPAPTSPAG